MAAHHNGGLAPIMFLQQPIFSQLHCSKNYERFFDETLWRGRNLLGSEWVNFGNNPDAFVYALPL